MIKKPKKTKKTRKDYRKNFFVITFEMAKEVEPILREKLKQLGCKKSDYLRYLTKIGLMILDEDDLNYWEQQELSAIKRRYFQANNDSTNRQT